MVVSIVKTNTLVTSLKRFGLSEYEAKAYGALLKLGQGNGYAVSKASGVPVSKVYQALSSLVGKGHVKTNGLNPPLYLPVPPEKFLEGISRSVTGDLDALARAVRDAATPMAEFSAMVHSNEAAFTSLLLDWTAAAKRNVLFSASAGDMKAYRKTLDTLPAKASVDVLSFGAFALKKGKVHLHRNSEEVLSELQDRWLIAVIDHTHAAMGFFAKKGGFHGMTLLNPDLAQVFTEFIIHDIAINQVMQAIPRAMAEKLEPDLAKLRTRLRGA